MSFRGRGGRREKGDFAEAGIQGDAAMGDVCTIPLEQKYCYVSWVLSYKAHYVTETTRTHRPSAVVTHTY